MAKKLNKHTFRLKVRGFASGKIKEAVLPAKVRKATKPVNIVLTADHVRQSIKLKGRGSCTKCAMAICVQENVDKFPHPVTGTVDWFYSRAFIASKEKNAQPIECYVYAHQDIIAKLNDKNGGQKALLEWLEKHGPYTVHLIPVHKRSPARKHPTPKDVKGKGSRPRPKGAHRRFIEATL